MKMTGVSAFIRSQMILQNRREIFSARRVAMVFGEISPKIRISSVSTPVHIPTAALPNMRIAMDVAREEAPILTRLLPIRIVLSIFPELPVTFRRVFAFLFPCSARVWIRILFAVGI